MKIFARIKQFLVDVKTEFKKVSWPTKNELMTSTMVVIVSLLFLAVFIGVFDFIFSKIITLLLRL